MNNITHEEIYSIVQELNNDFLSLTQGISYNMELPFEVLDNGFDTIVKLWGMTVWCSLYEGRSYKTLDSGEIEYEKMKDFLLGKVDNLSKCVNMFLEFTNLEEDTNEHL